MAVDILGAATVSTQVASITGSLADGAAAAGYAAFINSETGENPTVVKVSDGKVKLVLTQAQVQKMQNWIDDQVFGSLKPEKDQPSLQIDFGAVIVPEVIKYAVILSGIGFIIGYLISKKW